jgi:hypothetical protein
MSPDLFFKFRRNEYILVVASHMHLTAACKNLEIPACAPMLVQTMAFGGLNAPF